MNKFVLIAVIAIGAIIIGAVLLLGDAQPQDTQKREGPYDKAPAFSLGDYEGNLVALADFEGTPVILNVWAAWCPFCVEELKDFAKLQKAHQGELVIIAIDRAEPLETAKKFSDEVGVTDDLVLLLDPTDSFYKSIGGFSMPETLFVDGEGNILFHKRGPMTLEEMEQRVEELFEI